jgi:hypothetical protein
MLFDTEKSTGHNKLKPKHLALRGLLAIYKPEVFQSFVTGLYQKKEKIKEKLA